MSEDYCEMCDLPRSTCVHGMPAPAPVTAPAPTGPGTRSGSRARSTARTRTPAAPRTPTAPVRRAPRKWTPPEELAPHIVGVLQAAGGELQADDAFAALEERIGEDLLDGDRQLTPEGELRWRYAARRARAALVAEGVMVKRQPGVWSLG